MTPTARLYGAALLLLLVSVAVKFLVFGSNPLLDERRLARDIAGAMQADGYQTRIGGKQPWNRPMVDARRGRCRVRLRDITVQGADYAAIARIRLNDGRPIRLVQSGSYLPAYPRYSAEVKWRVQRELGRLGADIAIAPVIAVGAAKDCWPDSAVLRNLELHLVAD
jgi:hypothetical protein